AGSDRFLDSAATVVHVCGAHVWRGRVVDAHRGIRTWDFVCTGFAAGSGATVASMTLRGGFFLFLLRRSGNSRVRHFREAGGALQQRTWSSILISFLEPELHSSCGGAGNSRALSLVIPAQAGIQFLLWFLR